ncbi:MAG: hypothetical protein AABZ61_00215, partial [Bacteroidota bacterium]
MRKLKFIFLCLIGILGFFSCLPPSFAQEKAAKGTAMQEKSLYQRLGGYNAIAAVVDDFIARLVSDAQISRF